MKIHGLQKLTLLDYPGLTGCTVFLAGCDWRCPYCHNAELLLPGAPPLMDEEDLIAFLKTRKGLLDGVVFTGGEPLLHPGLPGLMARVKEMGYRVKLDTNGCHPEALREVLAQGLVDYVAMDVKNSPEKYPKTVGVEKADIEAVSQSIRLLLTGNKDYEFRTTVVKQLHDADSFRAIGQWIHGAKRCFLQPFVDRDTVPYAGLCAPDAEELSNYAQILRPHVVEVQIRGI